ncbi:type II toxin-antitoxin system HicB family antitoxin [Solidesulfovibrio sp.]
MDYIAILHKESDSDWGVSFPDFPGCITAGSSLEEARHLAGEALALHVRGMVEDGLAVPQPMALDAVARHPDFADGVAVLVSLPQAKPRSVRVNIMLPEPDLQAIDARARAEGVSRSSFLLRAARSALAFQTPAP